MKNTFLFLSVFWAVVVVSCSAPKSTEEASEIEEDTLALVEEPQTSSTSVMITHQVADFEAWLASYNQGDSMRKSGGMLKDFVYRSLEDSNMVTVAAYTENHESARAFMSNESLKEAMQAAGVISEPIISYWDITWMAESMEMPALTGYLMVSHGVEAYEPWEKLFVEDDSLRKANGVYAILAATDADSANNIGMFFGIEDFEKMNAFMSSDDLKGKMAAAGVLGEPVAIPVSAVQ